MTFGPDPSAGARCTSLDEFTKCLDHFQSLGYSEVDTAESYVGRKQMAFTAAAGWKSGSLSLATKYYPTPEAGHMAQVLRERLDFCLEQLQTSSVDIFYLHAPDRSRPFDEALETCNQLHKEGKFVRLGLSNYIAFEVAEMVTICRDRGWLRPTIYQGMYNAITRSIESELLVACRRYGIEVVIYNPLAGGLFSGKIKSKDLVPQTGRSSDTTAAQGKRYRERYFREATFEALQMIENVATKHDLSLVEIALRWCMHHSALRIGGMGKGGNDGIIIGASSFAQLEGNLTDLEKGPLPEEVVRVLDEAWMATKSTTTNYWHGELKYPEDMTERFFEGAEIGRMRPRREVHLSQLSWGVGLLASLGWQKPSASIHVHGIDLEVASIRQ